jgi:hypothetical protein
MNRRNRQILREFAEDLFACVCLLAALAGFSLIAVALVPA